MSKTTVDIDHRLLESAKEVLGTTTIKDTIQAALVEVVRRKDRARAINEIAGMVDAGDIDFGLPEEGITTEEVISALAAAGKYEEVASALTAAEKYLSRYLNHSTENPATEQGHRPPRSARHRVADLRWPPDGEGWQVAGRSGGAVVMRSGDSGLAIRIIDGTTLAASQAEAVHLAEQILKDSGAESSEH
jgi:hypothetical protein